MKTRTINDLIQKSLNQMFDHYYEVSVFTALPGKCHQDETFHTTRGVALKFKHFAAYAALSTCVFGKAEGVSQLAPAMQAIIRQINLDSELTIEVLEEAYEELIRKMVEMN